MFQKIDFNKIAKLLILILFKITKCFFKIYTKSTETDRRRFICCTNI